MSTEPSDCDELSKRGELSKLDYNAIVQDTQAHIRAYIAGMGVPRHDVDDVAQDVYIELYRFFDRIPGNVTPRQWLKGIARNLCFNYFRRTSRRNRLQREALVELLIKSEEGSEPLLSEGPVRSALDVCYEKLPQDARRMLKMKYEEELPSAQMAEKLQSTAEAIRVALFRIRHVLRECISRSLVAEQLL